MTAVLQQLLPHEDNYYNCVTTASSLILYGFELSEVVMRACIQCVKEATSYVQSSDINQLMSESSPSPSPSPSSSILPLSPGCTSTGSPPTLDSLG